MRLTEIQQRLRTSDPRYFQIASLSLLTIYGIVELDVEVQLQWAGLILIACLLTQWLCTRLFKLPTFEPRSALISGLSLCLLLRSNAWELVILAAVVTIASKFVLRWRGRHIFNPTNFGIVVLLLLSDQVWVSPGQWGSAALLGMFALCLGALVVRRAERSDVTYAFLTFYGLLVFGRAWWLGDSWAIPLHHLQSGAFIIFSFFMISDPKTTPDSRAGRILYALLVAFGAAYVHFVLYQPNGMMYALVASAALVPLINVLLPGRPFEWRVRAVQSGSLPLRQRQVRFTLGNQV